MEFTDFRCNAIETNLGTQVAKWADRNAAAWVLDGLADPTRCRDFARAHLPAFLFNVQVEQATKGCPACSRPDAVMTDDPEVVRCEGCGCIHTPAGVSIPFERAMKFVAFGLPMLANAGPDGQVHFDFVVATEWKGKAEVARVHGWADRKTKRVVQFG